RQNFSFNEINALANCNFLKSRRFVANVDLNDVFTQPRPLAEVSLAALYDRHRLQSGPNQITQ
ncbi:MAG: hypothetical protein ABI705_11155, partial [Aestuariivirga sp.]